MSLDREKARDVLRPWLYDATEFGWEKVLDALAACVTDEQQTVDRDALTRVLYELCDVAGESEDDPVPGAASDILALLRPDPLMQIIAQDERRARIRAEAKLAQIEALCQEAMEDRWSALGIASGVKSLLRGAS